MSKTHVRETRFTPEQIASADIVIDDLLELHDGKLVLAGATPKSNKMAIAARAVDAYYLSLGKPFFLRTASRFRLWMLRLESRHRRGIVSFFKKWLIHNPIIAARADRERTIGRAKPRNRGKQGYANRRHTPALQY